MKYAEVRAFGGPEQIRVVDGPDLTVSDGGLLIEVGAAGVNFADVMARIGVYAAIPSAPFRPGF